MKKQSISALGAVVLTIAVIVFLGVTMSHPGIIDGAARITATPTPVLASNRPTPAGGIIAATPTEGTGEACGDAVCGPRETCELCAIDCPCLTGTPEPRSLPTRDPAATPIETFQVIENQQWPAEGEYIDWTQPLMFGQYIKFATPTDVELYLIAFPIYASERVPTPNGCYADDARIPAGD